MRSAGLVPFLIVLAAPSAPLLMAQDQAAQSELPLAEDLVSIYKALSGGLSTETPDAVACLDRLGVPSATAGAHG